MRLAFCDVETSGLDPYVHEVWEIGVITRDGDERAEHHQFLPVTLQDADPTALRIGRFDERHPGNSNCEPWNLPKALALAELLQDRVIIGSNPTFDILFITRLLAQHHVKAKWFYRPIDMSTLAAGFKLGQGDAVDVPWRTRDMSSPWTDIITDDQHTALGDARWCERWFDRIMWGAV